MNQPDQLALRLLLPCLASARAPDPPLLSLEQVHMKGLLSSLRGTKNPPPCCLEPIEPPWDAAGRPPALVPGHSRAAAPVSTLGRWTDRGKTSLSAPSGKGLWPCP